MSFLAPLFLAGLAALAIPILIHLRQREEKKTVEFPSLMFLEGIPFQSRRRKTLKHPLLLALRLLALLLLVGAFARPFLMGDEASAAGTLGPRELVVLVDRSWSMTYGDQWSEAQAAARSALSSQTPQDRSTVILFDEGATAPVRSSPAPDAAVRAVDGAEPTDRATRYAPALRLARSILETSELPRREVVLITDFQASGWSGGEDLSLGSGVTFTPVAVGDPDTDWSNLSVASLDLRRSTAGARDAVIPTARVIQRGPGSGADAVTAVLEVDGQVRERVDMSLQGGAAIAEFGAVALSDQPQRGVVRIEGDDLTQDDAHYFVLSPGQEISVLVVEPEQPRPNASLFLTRALELSREPPFRVEVATSGLPSDLEEFDVIVLNDRDVPLGELDGYLAEGGGLFWAPGEADASSAGLTELIADVGLVRDHGRSNEVRLGTVDRNHPVFQPFRETGTGNFTTARFFRSRRLTPLDSASVLARFDDGTPALVEGRRGTGRVLVWAATLDTYWTDLPVQPVYLPFLHRSVYHLANRQEEIPARDVGSVLSADVAGGDAEGQTPSSLSGTWSAAVAPSGDRIELTGRAAPVVLEEAGIYELVEGEGDVGYPVAANVDPAEGDLTRRDPTLLVAAATGSAAATEESGEAGVVQRIAPEDVERFQGFWRYLLLGAFVFLVGETLLSNAIKEAEG